MDVNIWMVLGFLLAAYSVVANDSLQTLGTYISSNRARTPRWIQMSFICTITLVVLGLGWSMNNGDPTWGRLEHFPLPETFTWVYVLPPLAVLALTAWGAPVSTSFLVLTSFVPNTIGKLLQSSLSGYVLAFGLGWTVWWLGMWMLERWVFRRTRDHKEFNVIWYGLQWCSTGFLWSMWMVQDLANIFVYLPRSLGMLPMVLCTVILCIGLCLLVVIGGGPIQGVLNSKTNMADLRSATVIDFTFGFCLLIKAGLSSFPLSTTWVFLGLIGGREVALRFKEKSLDEVFTNRNGGELHQIIGNDIGKASVGVLVSVLFALGLQPLIAWSTG